MTPAARAPDERERCGNCGHTWASHADGEGCRFAFCQCRMTTPSDPSPARGERERDVSEQRKTVERWVIERDIGDGGWRHEETCGTAKKAEQRKAVLIHHNPSHGWRILHRVTVSVTTLEIHRVQF